MIDDELLKPGVAYCWLDEDSERVSPRHADVGIAISWYQRRPGHLRKIEQEEQRLAEREEHYHDGGLDGPTNGPGARSSYERDKIEKARKQTTLTGKDPVKLVRIMTRRTVEEISEAEQAIVDQIKESTNA